MGNPVLFCVVLEEKNRLYCYREKERKNENCAETLTIQT